MELSGLILVAFALAMDALAVSVGLGLSVRGSLLRCAARVAAAFGLFQAGMTLLGSLAGRIVSGRVEDAGHWVAAGILLAVGLHMAVEAVRKGFLSSARHEDPAEGTDSCDASTGWTLIGLAVATSIDAFGAGLGLAMIGAGVLPAALTIGAVAAVLSAAGVVVSGKIARNLGGKVAGVAELLGALILVGLAFRIAFGGG